jgi:hypothetical protein
MSENVFRGGVLVYKCRMCGGLDKSTHVPACMTALICLVGGMDFPKTWFGRPGEKVTVHICKSGRLGVADLIGAEMDEQEVTT